MEGMQDGLPYPGVGGVPNTVTSSVMQYAASKKVLDQQGMAIADMQTQQQLQHACDLQSSSSAYSTYTADTVESQLQLLRMLRAQGMPGCVPMAVPLVPGSNVNPMAEANPMEGFLNFVQFQQNDQNQQ
jgi:hypothetical protein